ncbi:hypothetical protein [Bradyrhizobium sp. DOA1]|uniref:hypothetical protein n=1 Tax=Bradyrhizobium sp. DOA1 TaxID=1126616 RepID=UPI00077C8472|nr:hypothetical protein [Bradyrhizobium sp. DOA1]KYH01515.1 hypothetical protein SE91_26035 [Bradyrhizobium sp. DOA1]
MNLGRVEEFGATLAGARKVGVMKDPTERFIRAFEEIVRVVKRTRRYAIVTLVRNRKRFSA